MNHCGWRYQGRKSWGVWGSGSPPPKIKMNSFVEQKATKCFKENLIFLRLKGKNILDYEVGAI